MSKKTVRIGIGAFLLIIGSLFLLGAVTKWIVWHHYVHSDMWR